MWEKVEVCSLLKAFHVPIAVRKVHYVGKGGGRGGGWSGDAQEHTLGSGKGNIDCFGLKISIFF